MSLEERNKQIIDFVAEIENNGIKQHSKEWLKAKEYTVGGSELATIIGMNPYEKSPSKKVMMKIGIDKFRSDQKVSWGNVFEDLIKEFTEETLDTTVHGDNIFIKVSDGPLSGKVSYSPDGLCVISNDILIKKYGNKFQEFKNLVPGEYSSVLLEFKAPYSREVDKIDIPSYYEPQPTMGLDIIKFCNIALFIEAVFRICLFSDLDNARIHKNYPACHPESSDSGKIYSRGVMIVYGHMGHELVKEINEVYNGLTARNDLASLGSKILDRLFIELSAGRIKFQRTGPCSTIDSLYRRRKRIIKGITKEIGDAEDQAIIGTISWKLLQYLVKPVTPKSGYLESHAESINRFVDVCSKARQLEDRESVAEYLSMEYNEDLMSIY